MPLFLITVLSSCENGPFSSQSADLPSSAEISPNDPLFSDGDGQWYLETIRAPAAWGLYEANAGVSYAGRDVRPIIVSVIDSGVVAGHEDLAGVLTTDGMYFVGGVALPIPQGLPGNDIGSGHGTHVSGLIAAEGNNGVGISGGVYNGWPEPTVGLRPVASLAYDPFSGRVTGTVADVVAGVIYAGGNDSDRVAGAAVYSAVMNMSLGASSLSGAESLLFENAIDLAAATDVLVVAASGNASQPFIDYPARYEEVIAVGAIDRDLNLSTFSNWGAQQELVAPGAADSSTPSDVDGVVSTYRPSGYTKLAGTSMATPLVAAAAAIVRSANPYLSAGEVREILQDTARDLGAPGFDTVYGYGLIDMEAALRAALSEPYGRFSSSRSEGGGSDVTSGALSSERRRRYDEANASSVWDPAGSDTLSVIVSSTASTSSVRELPGVVQIDEARVPDGILMRVRLETTNAASIFAELKAIEGVLLVTQERTITFN